MKTCEKERKKTRFLAVFDVAEEIQSAKIKVQNDRLKLKMNHGFTRIHTVKKD